jgi:rhamnosyltransferase
VSIRVPNASVVIPTKNGGPVFVEVLEALKAQEYEGGVQVTVIDSGSTDDTVSVASQYGAHVTAIPSNEFNHGLTRNRAIESCAGDIVILMSQDAIPGDRYLIRNLVGAFDDSRVAGAYARQVPREDADVLTKRDGASALAGRTSGDVHWIKDWEAYRNLTPIERYYFCNFDDVCSAVRKSVWRSIPFRAAEFGEDIDWGQRILEAGWKIAYCPEAYVVHSHARSFVYLYRRSRSTLKQLYEQFGVCTVPSIKSVMTGTVHLTLQDWRYVIRREKRLPHLLMVLGQIPFHSFGNILGQYRGARDALEAQES